MKTFQFLFLVLAAAVSSLGAIPAQAQLPLQFEQPQQSPQQQLPGVDPVLVWCRSTVDTLNLEEIKANEARYFYGADAEVAALKNGLALAEQSSFPGTTGPLTLTAIRRGKFFAAALEAQLGQYSGGTRTVSHFLHQYYAFIRKVALEIDIPYFIPRTFCQGCRPTIPDYAYEIERRSVDYAAAELKLALEKMTTGQDPFIFPIGPADAPSNGFLTVLALAANHVVEDLRPSLWGSPFACLIYRLQGISSEANATLASGVSEWQKAATLRRLHQETTYFARELLRPSNCPGNGYPSNWPQSQWPQNPADNYPQQQNPADNYPQQQWPQQQPNPADNGQYWPRNPADAPRGSSLGYNYDVEAYKRVYGHSVPHKCGAIGGNWAERVSRSVFMGEYEVDLFLQVYDRTCSEDSSVEIATAVRNGTFDYSAWSSVYGYSVPHKCGAISLRDANDIARRCARREIRVREFLELYSRTCNVSTALNIGGRF